MKVRSYKELNIWKKGIEIVDRIYEITEKFPQKELYNLLLKCKGQRLVYRLTLPKALQEAILLNIDSSCVQP